MARVRRASASQDAHSAASSPAQACSTTEAIRHLRATMRLAALGMCALLVTLGSSEGQRSEGAQYCRAANYSDGCTASQSCSQSWWTPRTLNSQSFHAPPDSNVPDGNAIMDTEAARQALNSRIHVVLVLDPPYWGDYEAVEMTDVTRATLLPWLASLRDALTITADRPEGQPLKTHFQNEWAGMPCNTYAEHVTAALESAPSGGGLIKLPKMLLVLFQLTTVRATIKAKGTNINYSLPTSNVRVTTVKNFWAAAESTNEVNVESMETRIVGVVDGDPGTVVIDDIVGLRGSVVILPRWVPWVTNVDHVSVTDVWDPPSKWTPEFMLQQARHFLDVQQVDVVPDMVEWTAMSDKREPHKLYVEYYRQDPAKRTPPFETVFVYPPVSPADAHELCLSEEFQPSEELVQATMQAIWKGMRDLNAMSPPGSEGRALVEAESAELGQPYVLKRLFAEGGIGLAFTSFPTALLEVPAADSLWLATTAKNNTEGMQASAETSSQFLQPAALHLLSQGCGLGWLLQFKYTEFPAAEYSVYLMGGANAEQKHIYPVYRPMEMLGSQPVGSYLFGEMAAKQLPPGYFANELLPAWENEEAAEKAVAAAVDAAGELPPGPLRDNSSKGWRSRMWWSPKIHQMLIDTAMDVARAIAAGRSEDGTPLARTLGETFIRADIVLLMPWNDTAKRREVVPRINEMHWINDASLKLSVWDSSAEARASGVCRSSTNGAPMDCHTAPPAQLASAARASQANSSGAAMSASMLRLLSSEHYFH